MRSGVVVAQGKMFFVAPLIADSALMAAPLDGADAQVVYDHVQGIELLASDGDAVYFPSDSTHLTEVDAKTGATAQLQLDGLPEFEDVVAHGGSVYVAGADPTQGLTGVIERVPEKGGPAQRIWTSSKAGVRTMLVDGSGIYWAEVDSATPGSISIRHAALDGSGVETLLTGLRAVSLAESDGVLYFSEGNRIAKLTAKGHDVTLVDGLEHPYALQVSGQSAVWLDLTTPTTSKIETACIE